MSITFSGPEETRAKPAGDFMGAFFKSAKVSLGLDKRTSTFYQHLHCGVELHF